ncbi:hypothetical protein BLL52_4094 [Rhodoferax antarcticus ANT.BR]|uniref:Uncharacterized protein n=2 Tax=Rhodoferax antarcticus TaxID=81479 RepID=A0A1Q8Y8V0_9BURK|nr:hypothetical protein BLL52_4094 [Rhodoferax antarcticus ANT.BR]
MRVLYGRAGRSLQKKDYGIFSVAAARKLLEGKVAKGYEIQTVNDKPFNSNDLSDALRVIALGNGWQATSTSQPERKIKAVEVTVTFDPSSAFAPVW